VEGYTNWTGYGRGLFQCWLTGKLETFHAWLMAKPPIIHLGLAKAQAFIRQHHRHHAPPSGHRFSLGLLDPHGAVIGVAMAGRPIARFQDDGLTVELTRLCCIPGYPNAASQLSGAVVNAARHLGYLRCVTYSLSKESGASLRGAGWVETGVTRGHGWDMPGRRRQPATYSLGPKRVWELELVSEPVRCAKLARLRALGEAVCGQCGRRPVRWGQRERELLDVPLGGVPEHRIVKQSRWHCRHCHQTWEMTDDPEVVPGCRATRRLQAWLADQPSSVSHATLARMSGLSVPTISRIRGGKRADELWA
jgi:hypothetical protein